MEYIYTSPSLSKDLCEKIIIKFEEENDLKYQGVTYKGLDKNVKDTTDIIIPENDSWNEINDYLSCELEKNLKKYLSFLNKKDNYREEYNYGTEYTHLQDKLYLTTNFMIQKYEKGKGKYIYHEDGGITTKSHRVITYLWYLNDVKEGGETDFFGGTFHIKPEEGKLLLFPSFWSFPHRGNQPKSSHKYIITGWLYRDNVNRDKHIPNISIINRNSIQYEKEQEQEQESYLEIEHIHENMEEKKLIFDYFYNPNKLLFQQYKNNSRNDTQFQFYTEPISRWLIEKVKDIENIELHKITTILHFTTSSFDIILDYIKMFYNYDVSFNITEWLFIKTKDNKLEERQSDICIQIELSTGIVYIRKKYEFIPNSFVYFVNFTFEYLNDKYEKKNLTIKEIITPFLEQINKDCN